MNDLDVRAIRRMVDMHAVYRMFDEAGRILYIGFSGRAGRRFDQHSTKAWFPQVANITLEWFPTKAAATLAERRAIEAEQPRYNTAGKTKPLRSPRERSAMPKFAELLTEQFDFPVLPAEDIALIAAVRRELASDTARQRREAIGLLAGELASMLGVTRSSVNGWESGRTVPSGSHALAYGKALAAAAPIAALSARPTCQPSPESGPTSDRARRSRPGWRPGCPPARWRIRSG